MAIELDQSAKYIESCKVCKVFLLALGFLLGVFTIGFVLITSSRINKSLSIAIIVSWFVAVLGGWIIINIFRIFIISVYTPKVYDNELLNINSGNGRKITGSAKLFDILFVPEDAKDIMRDYYDVQNVYEKILK